MMELAEQIQQMMESCKILYLKTDTEIVDFLPITKAILQIYGKNTRIDIPLDTNLKDLISLLNFSIFQNHILIFWDLKSIISYIKRHSRFNLNINENTYDLKLLEKYIGLELETPATWLEAVKRSQIITNQKLKNIHRTIHIPLSVNVIPTIENTGVFDLTKNKSLYSKYNIEAQPTGRMSCTSPCERYINSHNTKVDELNFKPKQPDDLFIYFDFRNMEVCVLQYLSKDEKLYELLKEKDVYAAIYKHVTNIHDIDSDIANKNAKALFLPIVYGQGIASIATSFGISNQAAELLYQSTVKTFPNAFQWLSEMHEQAAKNMLIEDCLGRRRIFEEKTYKARQFVVASPAAMFCMEKLIDLQSVPDAHLIFSIHDGYYLSCKKECYQKVIKDAQTTLEQPSKLLPGLSIKTKCKVGYYLNKLKKYPLIY